MFGLFELSRLKRVIMTGMVLMQYFDTGRAEATDRVCFTSGLNDNNETNHYTLVKHTHILIKSRADLNAIQSDLIQQCNVSSVSNCPEIAYKHYQGPSRDYCGNVPYILLYNDTPPNACVDSRLKENCPDSKSDFLIMVAGCGLFCTAWNAACYYFVNHNRPRRTIDIENRSALPFFARNTERKNIRERNNSTWDSLHERLEVLANEGGESAIALLATFRKADEANRCPIGSVRMANPVKLEECDHHFEKSELAKLIQASKQSILLARRNPQAVILEANCPCCRKPIVESSIKDYKKLKAELEKECKYFEREIVSLERKKKLSQDGNAGIELPLIRRLSS